VNKAEFDVRLPTAPVTEFEKTFQASRPAKVKGKYGTPPDGRRATRPNTKLSKAAEMIGEITSQIEPMTVCRYITVMFRRQRRKRS